MTEFSLETAAGKLTARLTPWDERALGFATAEITSFNADEAAVALDLLQQAEFWAADLRVRYLFGRIDANLPLLRRALLQAGHRFVETSLSISRSGMGNLPAVPRGMLPTLRPATAADIPQLRQIAHDDFVHGRFLEDPEIDGARARMRTANWIEDLVGTGLAYAAESRGRVIGFHAERIRSGGHHAELLLTGTAAPYAMLAMPLWATALESLAARDIRLCTTLVSAANTGILNLYARLGFQFNSTLAGFRKFL
ncbi:hypothetical protein [Thermomonas sp. HDW16]|uniref:hypothetical protein n=1 Tax=Thermomonas sp. HDW16 TaxID=2714945 RepID=UPI0014079239|nr:hypothetical protein [Thermomonas sp. HDW16]QIL21507.1 hypothetical protein G7079_12600 [Thermomonas sp. HDW16]